ncbi:hypothetical protein PCANC_01953 [Puccinia coronata f. sp. avenae]|uniref:Uncharacterized protein n=1 Tax=Puccinia coronata f. sp. avenae TaxID=200324 RepID=A0A2N5SEQ3_9BASI|nr:hypothetical protein PCANC_17313 [Puccinia coronata f. sp. avenae]PLW57088.1 hypothetical protein PCANC_01953 [Puccinia coronata f. sp. avenae]
MPIRLLFLLLFLPSTFLSSHKVCHHVDALALYEPHNVGWTGHLFHSSSQSAAFLALLSSNTPPVSELKPDAFSELFLEREGSRWAAFGQDQTKSQTIIPPKSHEPEKIPEQSAQLQRRQFATNEPIQETVAGNLDQETRRSRAEELSSEPPDSSPNQAPSGKSTPSKASQNSPVKAETQSPPIFDEGMRGLVIILMVASFTGIFLFIRIKLVGQAPSQTLEVSEKEDFVLPPVVPDYKGGANITAPLGSGYATKSSRKDSIASQIPLKSPFRKVDIFAGKREDSKTEEGCTTNQNTRRYLEPEIWKNE